MRLLKNIFANPYLFDEGSAVSSFAFLFEGLPGEGLLSLEMPLGQHGAPNASPFEDRMVRWVRQNERTLSDEMSPDYLRVK